MNQHTRDTISTILPPSWHWLDSPKDIFTQDICASEDKKSWVSVGLASGVYSVQLVIRGVYLLNFQYTDVEDILTDVQPLLDFVPTSPVLPSIPHLLFSASLRHQAGTLFTMVDNTEYVIDWSIELNYGATPYRIIVHSSHGIVNASCENYNSRLSICSLASDEVGMRDLLDVLIMRTNHWEKYVQQ